MADLFTWTPDLSVHVQEIDDQHQELFRKFNEVGEAVWDGRGKDEIGKLIDFLADYLVLFFHYGIQKSLAGSFAICIADYLADLVKGMPITPSDDGLVQVKSQNRAFKVPLFQVFGIDGFNPVNKVKESFLPCHRKLGVANTGIGGTIRMC